MEPEPGINVGPFDVDGIGIGMMVTPDNRIVIALRVEDQFLWYAMPPEDARSIGKQLIKLVEQVESRQRATRN